MTISGSSNKAAKFLANLNENTFVECVRDILALKGHSGLKVVDGPGDGCRDIHSLDPEGHKYITQCKFHKKKKKTVSSREIGELPLGMVKLGYRRGLFCTNAKISPQSKREFIDNYPDLELDFREGAEIPNEVFNNIVLRSIWFDGQSIDRLSYIVIFQALARDLISNKPIDISKAFSKPTKFAIELENFEIEVSIRENSISYSNFEPYLAPEKKTIKEGWGWGSCAEFVISGPIPIDQILTIQKKLSENIIQMLVKDTKRRPRDFALRLGKSQLAPLAGDAAGTKIPLNSNPFTIVRVDGQNLLEKEWIFPQIKSGWFLPRFIQANMANWARWYQPKLDLCLDIRILSKPSEYFEGMIEEQQAYLAKWWNESLFALISENEVSEFEGKGIQRPTEKYDWFEGQVLCSWKHGNLSEGFRSLMIEPEHVDENEKEWQDIFEVDPIEYKKSYDRLKSQIISLGATIIDPRKARHMVAVVSSDPFPDQHLMEYRSVDIMYTIEKIPSPISPSSRRANMVICWLLDEKAKLESKDSLCDEVEKIVSNTIQKWKIASIVFDNETMVGTYFVLYLERSAPFGIESTDKTLNNDLEEIEVLLEKLQEKIIFHYPNGKRATREFWFREIGMDFEIKEN